MEQGLLEKEGGHLRGIYGDFIAEVRRLGYLAGPLMGVTLLQFLVQVISSMMVGHLGELALSSASIATSLSVVTGFSPLTAYFCPLLRSEDEEENRSRGGGEGFSGFQLDLVEDDDNFSQQKITIENPSRRDH